MIRFVAMRIVYFSALLYVSVIGFGQAPQRFSFQAVVRHPDTSLVTYKQISVRLSILKGDINGTVVYSEIHSPRTNGLGLFTLEVGGGTVLSGGFSSIDWGNDSYFIKREIDPTGGTNYTISGTSQMLSVPYALHAETASKLDGHYSWNYPQGFLKGEVITLVLGNSDSYLVPDGNIFTYLGSTGCPLLIDDKAILLVEGSILSNGKITKFSSTSECTPTIIRGYLTPQPSSFNYMDTILSNTINYQVPENKIVRFTNFYGTCVNGVALGFRDFIFFGGEVINVCRNTGYPVNSEFYFSGYFIK